MAIFGTATHGFHGQFRHRKVYRTKRKLQIVKVMYFKSSKCFFLQSVFFYLFIYLIVVRIFGISNLDKFEHITFDFFLFYRTVY